MKRLAPWVAALAGLMFVAAPAHAFWAASGSGTHHGSVATLPGGNQPTVTATLQTVTVTWTQTAFQGSRVGQVNGGYLVRRYPSGGGAPVDATGTCAGTVTGHSATLTCEDFGVPAGAWEYTVTPILKSWTGAEGPVSTPVSVVALAPNLTSAVALAPSATQTTGGVTLTWDAISGVSGYNLYRRTSSGSYDFDAPLNGATLIGATSYTDDGSELAPATTYGYVVRAVVGTAQSGDSNELTVTPISRPAPPTNPSAVATAGADIDLAWTAVSGVTGYNVYRRTASGDYDFANPLNGIAGIAGTTFTDSTALDGTHYRYVIRSYVVDGTGTRLESLDSAERSVTADGSSPTATSLADPGSPLKGTVTLSATAVDDGSGIATVRFQAAAAGGSTWTDLCAETTAPSTCAVDTTTFGDGLYDLRVIATDVAGNAATSTTVAGRRIDNTAPTATMSNPGSPLRGTVTLQATAADSGSGLALIRVQRAATGTGIWTDVCTATTSPATCSLTTTTLADGGYDLRATVTDLAGNVGTSAIVSNRIIDNTAPTGMDIQTANVSGTLARPDTGDVITFTFSEAISPTSVVAGWSGAATAVRVRITNGNPDVVSIWNAAGTVRLPLGTFTSGKKYVTQTMSFTTSTMRMSGNTILVTLGGPTGTTQTSVGSTTLQWTISGGVTDLAGNPITAATVPETGAADRDF